VVVVDDAIGEYSVEGLSFERDHQSTFIAIHDILSASAAFGALMKHHSKLR
jgi:hypothetical protein